MDIQELKSYVETHIARVVPNLEAEFHGFVAWVEGEDNVKKAVSLLESKGYSVTPPAATI